jgi:hypothetical protein
VRATAHMIRSVSPRISSGRSSRRGRVVPKRSAQMAFGSKVKTSMSGQRDVVGLTGSNIRFSSCSRTRRGLRICQPRDSSIMVRARSVRCCPPIFAVSTM